MRIAEIERKTMETEIKIKLDLDGKGMNQINTGIKFLDHLLVSFSKNGMFDVEINAKGDLEVDGHHTVEDLGLVLGQAFDKALGERRGINRYGFFLLSMDEALAEVAIDLGGRPYLQFETQFKRDEIGGLSTELAYDFFEAFTRGSRANISVRLLSGRNDHHKLEAIFKAFGRALRMACEPDTRQNGVPSTKGVI
ncbi:imidazoleglycerol-phosphate dehydratase HisB [Candidatus Micrarchaeota archaeon]|nr:imidazoleglycerol-phosphate dehydratase HisB [Candidatus Micrarchaeota archaeon]